MTSVRQQQRVTAFFNNRHVLNARLWYVGVFVASLVCCLLFSLGFPYAVTTPDTFTYYWLFRDFHLWSANSMDWIRTIPFAFVLGSATHFPEPHSAVLLFHFFLFAIGITSVAWMCAAALQSVPKGALCALVLVTIEVCLMQTFFFNFFLMSDVMYAHLILIGSMLILGGWVRRKRRPILTGFFALGIAAFTRPIGIGLFPVWIVFGYFFLFQRHNSATKNPLSAMSFLLCISFFLGPDLLWATRNLLVYSHFKLTAFTTPNLLPHVLSLVDEDDKVFTDPIRNHAFIGHLRAFRETFHPDHPEIYRFGGNDTLPNPLARLLMETPTYQKDHTQHWDSYAVSQSYFELDAVGIPLALRIIIAHPREYFLMTMGIYQQLLTSHPYPFPSDTLAWYRATMKLQSSMPGELTLFFPPNGTIDASRSSPQVLRFLDHFYHSAFMHRLIDIKVQWFPLLVYAVILLSILFFLMPKKLMSIFPKKSHELCIIILMLTLTALSQYLLTAAVEEPVDRYSLPGNMGLHLSLILGGCLIFTLIQAIVHQNRLTEK